jgi:hypothetical protein
VARERPGERVELWFMDEARVGQKGRLTHAWYQKGVRPRGPRQQGFASAYLFGAVCPERGEGVALVLPEVSNAAMGVAGSWPSWAGRSRPGPTPRSCSTAPAGTPARA